MSSRKETQQLKWLETFIQCMERNVWMKELAEDGLQNSEVEISPLKIRISPDVLLSLMIHFLKQPLKKILVYLLRNWPESLVQTIQLFIIIFNNLEKFLNLENGCLMNYLKTISNPKLKSALLFILNNLLYLFWMDLWLATKNESFIKMLSIVDSGLVKGTDLSYSWEENFMGEKVLLSIWWDCQGIIHFELLPPNAIINAQLYWQQLEHLNQALRKKRPALVNQKGVMFHQDYTWHHTARITSQKIEELGWEKIPHQPYSPDLAPSDYHLFCRLQNHLEEKAFAMLEEVKNAICEFFNPKPKEFYNNGFNKLADRKRL